MTIYKSERLRNVVLLGHGGAGKTSLSDAMLFDCGGVNRIGRVDEGTSVSDHDEEERRRGMSINTSLIPCEWKEHKLNVLDTPGYMDFVGEVVGAVRVADSAVVVVDASGGVEVGTEQVWYYADRRELPRLIFVNKMERENINLDAVLDQVRSKFDVAVVPITLPIGAQADFAGVVDLLAEKAYMGDKGTEAPIPADMADVVEEARMALVEAAAEGEDALMEKYFEELTLTNEEVLRGMKGRIRARTLIPVLVGSAGMNIGVQALMRHIVQLLPSPVEAGPYEAVNPATNTEMSLQADSAGTLAALVFKTVADPYVGKLSYFRVFSGTIESDSRAYNPRLREEERLGQIYTMRGKEQMPVARVPAGDIGAVARLSETLTGDTLCDRGAPVILPPAEYPNPLYSVAVTPKTKADAAKISPTLTRLSEQDPTLSWRQDTSTHETIVSGMGDTHINVAIRRMEETFGLGLDTAVPRVP
ncbi:MAG TPA: GTP-binding protein, partial [Halothiobacillaceae bacterium]|nr:GTP-binding protein [Halothiobacillaceae bacterium]